MFDKRILSSTHINFLFGAGVNGTAFPQLTGFPETITELRRIINRSIVDFEADIDSIRNNRSKQKVLKIFKKEFLKFSSSIDYLNSSIRNLKDLLFETNKIVDLTENRTKTTKQVNIYSFNYDNIVENVLKEIGLLTNIISSTNIDNHDKFFNMIGYDYITEKFIPTYAISKIHGDIDNPILPGTDKYSTVLASKYFEIVYNMKVHLCRRNSVLIVIGYSGKDEHINRLLKDCLNYGLTIYWYKFSAEDSVPVILAGKVIICEPKEIESGGGKMQDSTKTCSEDLKKIWLE